MTGGLFTIVLADGNGNRIRHSVQSYLDAYDEHTEKLRTEPSNVAAQIMLGKLDPATVKLFQAVKPSVEVPEDQLKRGMFRNGCNWSLAAAALFDTKRQEYWQLYYLQRLAINDRQKLFESDYPSLILDGPA